MKMKHLAWLFIITILAGFGCSDNPTLSLKDNERISMRRREELKEIFGRSLALSVSESVKLREIIKIEALKKFDLDFDILYHLIKEQELENGYTVRSLILRNIGDEKLLKQIESELPTLTIFVPELPQNSFSAASWNVIDEVPFVAISSNLTNDVKIIGTNLQEFTLSADLIPSFPVLVIKENERVVVEDGRTNAQVLGRKLSTKTANSPQFIFLSDCFDGSYIDNHAGRVTNALDQKIKDAFEIYKNVDGWQRDYVYYGITPSQPNGAFTYDFQEHITTFTLTGDPNTAYSKISDQSDDPKKKNLISIGGSTPTQNSGWTGGSFEFMVKLLFNSKNGLGEEFITYFNASPSELFILSYERMGVTTYVPKIQSLKSKTINLPLINWDLNNYASTIKIEIEEVDLTVTTSTSETRTVKFATNFAIEGVIKKIGLKFGSSLEDTQTQTTEKTFTQGNDPLGGVIINFADNIVVSSNPSVNPTSWTTREYQSGWFSISVEPKKVQ